jgi:hypothetical protein
MACCTSAIASASKLTYLESKADLIYFALSIISLVQLLEIHGPKPAIGAPHHSATCILTG